MSRVTYILFFLGLYLAMQSVQTYAGTVDEETKCLTLRDTFVAGETISISFSNTNNGTPLLFVQNSYSSTLLKATTQNDSFNFTFPDWLAKKTGTVNWTLLLGKKKLLAGTIKIIPNGDEPPLIESYFGPRQILAGDNDYSMLVLVPTDNFDNPLPNNTLIKINQQYNGNIQSSEIKTDYLMAWQNIYSRHREGKVLVSAVCNTTSSKELVTEIYPANADDFEISAERVHNFADGNQLLELYTSRIEDAFGNIISDGTLVEFRVINAEGALLKTYGETINGVAVAKILHPEFSDDWKIKAYITGLAESNELQLSFTSVANNFPVSLSRSNRLLTVGPVKSFINQLVPDGIRVNLMVFKGEKHLTTLSQYTSSGIATFPFEPETFPVGVYQFRIETLGLKKELLEVKLDETVK